MEKKKNPAINLIKAVIFCAGFLLIFIGVSYTLRQHEGSASRKNICGFYAEKKDSLDMVLIGGSSVFDFWEPIEFWKENRITSYNFAIGSLPPQFIVYGLKEIRKTQSPQLYVIDLRPFTVAEVVYNKEKNVPNMDNDASIRNFTDNMKYSLNRLEMIYKGVQNDEKRLPYYLDLGMYHTRWPKLLDPVSLSYMWNEEKDPTKGFKLVDKVKTVEFNDYSRVKKAKPLSDRLSPIFTEILDYCKEQDLQVLFLVNHYCQSKNQKMTYNAMAQMAEAYGYPVLNTNDHYQEIGMDFTTDYFDASHTNIFGADKYTRFVSDYILNHYELSHIPDEKNDAQWDADAQLWDQQVKELKETIQSQIDERRKTGGKKS